MKTLTTFGLFGVLCAAGTMWYRGHEFDVAMGWTRQVNGDFVGYYIHDTTKENAAVMAVATGEQGGTWTAEFDPADMMAHPAGKNSEIQVMIDGRQVSGVKWAHTLMGFQTDSEADGQAIIALLKGAKLITVQYNETDGTRHFVTFAPKVLLVNSGFSG